MSISVDRTILIPVIVASITISLILQWLADSGVTLDFTRLTVKGAAGIVSYVFVLLWLSRRSRPKWKSLLLVALFGTLINSALTTVTDTCYSYLNEYQRGVFSFSEWSNVWIGTLVGREVISPLFMVLFLAIAFPLYGIMLLINREYRHP